jgi:hypothetical protein
LAARVGFFLPRWPCLPWPFGVEVPWLWTPLFLHALDPNAFTTRAGEEVHTEGEADPEHTHSHEENRDPDHRLHKYPQLPRPPTSDPARRSRQRSGADLERLLARVDSAA